MLSIIESFGSLSPPLASILINTYRSPASLLVSGEVILSEEGTTQGDPLAMPMYALAAIPLMDRLPRVIAQVWYADDACACGALFGLFCKCFASKTWLVCKEDCHSDATTLFSSTDVNATTHSRICV